MATFTVDSIGDMIADDGVTTLREALQSANQSPGADTINFAPSLDSNTIPLNAQLVISDAVEIIHDGVGRVTIDAARAGSRALTIGTPAAPGGFDVLLRGLVITNGETTDAGNASGTDLDGGDGGGIRSFTSGIVTIENSIVSNNLTRGDNADGGGIFARNGTLRIQNSFVTGNQANGNTVAGGGIYSAGALEITGTTFSYNRQATHGGGIFIQAGSSASISASIFSMNSADTGGGGIYNGGTLSLSDSTVTGNVATSGGGIYHDGDGPMTVLRTTVSDNETVGRGGGISSYGSGSIEHSTISGNRAVISGGGIHHPNNPMVNILQSTISGNVLSGINGKGGGFNGTARIQNSTIVGNRAYGGGAGVYSNFILTRSSIIAGNIGQDIGSDVSSLGNNVVGSGTLTNQNMDTTGVVDPRLGPLADNGGQTRTHLPLADSLTIDAGGQPTDIPALLTDQRGSPRVSGAGIDVGAVELNAAANTAPTISDIADQATQLGSVIGPIAFTVGDAQTAVGNLKLSVQSSNTAVVPTGNIAAGGSGANRTVTVTPAAAGTSTITVTVRDEGNLTASDTFLVTATAAGNTAPTISNIADQATQLGSVIGPIAFTVGDAQTAVGNLTLSVQSSNTAVVPTGNIAAGGSGANRTVTVTPAAAGTSTITLTVRDEGNLTSSDTFVVTATAAGNTAPTISDIADQATQLGSVIGPIAFTVGDAQTAVGNLTLSVQSSNTAVVPAGNIAAGGSGANRTVTVTPAAAGTSTITLTVRDEGNLTASDTFVVTATAAGNTAPTISDIADQATQLGSVIGPIAFTVGDAQTAVGNLTLSVQSSNTAVVPAGNIAAGGSGANRTVTVTPAAAGTSTITLTVRDDGNLTASDTFVVTANTIVNTAPTITDIVNQSTLTGTPTSAIPFAIGDDQTAASALAVTAISSNQTLVPNGSIQLGGSGTERTLTITPTAGQTGSAAITVSVSDGSLSTNEIFVLTVNPNSPPTISSIADRSTQINTSTGPIGFTINDTETAANTLVVTATSNNAALVPNANLTLGGSGTNRTLSIQPAAGQTGNAAITVTVSDGGQTAMETFVLTVNAVTPPTISSISNQSTPLNTATAAIPFTVGDAETAAGALVVTASSSNAVLVPEGNLNLAGSGADRTITITPADGQTGSVAITVLVTDEGNQSASQTFVLTVTPNTPPTISSIANQSIQTNASTGAIAFTIGDAETAVGTLNVSATSVDQTLVPASGLALSGAGADRTLTVTPAAGQSGGGTINVTVTDEGNLTATSSFIITVTPNTPPTVGNITDQITEVNTPTQSIPFVINDGESTADALQITALSSDTSLVPVANVVFSGSGSERSLLVAPAPGRTGATAITVLVSDGSLTASESFVLTVNQNTPPTVSNIENQTTKVNTALGPIAFTVDDTGTAASALAVSAASNNQALLPNANLLVGGGGTDRTLTITPAAGQTGSATVTVSVGDGTHLTTQSFVVNVNAVTPPTISDIANQLTQANLPTGALPFTIGDGQTAASDLNVVATSANTTLVPNENLLLSGSGADRTLTITPAADQTGSAAITVTVTDEDNLPASTLFVLTVIPNTPPTITAISDQTTQINTSTGAIAFTIGDGQTPAATLDVSAVSIDQTLVPAANIALGGAGANRTITVTPASGQSGAGFINVTVTDDGNLTATESFIITVTPNTPPTISAIGDQTTEINTPIGPVSFTVGDVETAAGALAVTATSVDQTLIPDGNLVVGGSGANRTLTITPANGQSGSGTINITVTDEGGLTETESFVVTVTPDTPPTISNITDQFTQSGISTGAIAFTVGDAETPVNALAVAATSSNQTLVPDGNIALGGTGASRTLTITPAAVLTGATTITVTVTDGSSLSASASFGVTVSAASPIQITSAPPAGETDPVLPSGPPPTSWAQQRSSLRVIEIDLPTALIADATAADLIFTNQGVGGSATPVAVPLNDNQIATSGDRRRITLSFADNELSDGVYHLQIGSSVTGGAAIDIPGTLENKLFVLRGDWNGDGIITNGDFAPFSYWFLNGTPPAYMDLRDPVGINGQDFTVFLQRLGTNLFPGVSQQSVSGMIGQAEALFLTHDSRGEPPRASAALADSSAKDAGDEQEPFHACGPVEIDAVHTRDFSTFDLPPSMGPTQIDRPSTDQDSVPSPVFGPKTFKAYQEELLEESIDLLSRMRNQ